MNFFQNKLIHNSALITHYPLTAYRQYHPIGILLLAFALRFYNLEAQSLWADEGNSVALAQASFRDIAFRTAADIHPPFYYWLLKLWITVLGQSEFALRALSATLAVILVALIYRLGQQLFSPRVGLAAAFIAALSPFQIYYAQETRMYMLLTTLGSLALFLALLAWQSTDWKRQTIALGTYSLVSTLGLYTHYAFPVMLGVINGGIIFYLGKLDLEIKSNTYSKAYSPSSHPKGGTRSFSLLWGGGGAILVWLACQLIPLLLYLPWLPTAYRQVTTWPRLMEQASWVEISLTLMQYLSLGLTAEVVSQIWLGIFGGILVLGIVRGWDGGLGIAVLWLVLPVGLTAVVFRPAYLKFLLMASPAFCLILGLGIGGLRSTVGSLGLALLIAIPSGLSIQAAFTDSRFQRDNYRDIVAIIESVATAEDAIILHAPGQQEVFGYYYQPHIKQAQVYPLPQHRPLQVDLTQKTLETLAQQSDRLFGVFWATQEADPDQIIETWLNRHTFKANDIWFGNVRLVSYAAPLETTMFIPTDHQFAEGIRLRGYHITPQTLQPGDILRVTLQWQIEQALTEDYVVFLQLLNEANHLVGQRDARPQLPTTDWITQQPIVDQHGIFLLPGTPPRPVRLIVGLYDALTGIRLTLSESAQTFIDLATLSISRNPRPLPSAALQIQYPLLEPPLLGYDLYKLGQASSPETPIYPGDPLHLVLYWQGPKVRPQNDMVTVQLVDAKKNMISSWSQPAAGLDYPMTQWVPDELIRGQFTFFLGHITPGTYQLKFIFGDAGSQNHITVYTHHFQVISPNPVHPHACGEYEPHLAAK